ncbi:hypothetical protein [Nocardioides albus]|uniref:Ig-like domain-containing protein n=1 Tax=Nocardioides albus TaxID=1841 RepID=A0A7W5A7D1_9ACTN|nr:hypothetical protein [Nocardioides albus]MBB3091051.1 hypothetical protein [Nocardioides albus]GGU34685.1 hypothetical protein GCM10007979_37340 [Nocardioides albus]
MKQHIVRIAALGLSTTAIVGVGSALSAGHAATAECTADSPKLIRTIDAVTHLESRYAKTVPGAHHEAVTHIAHHEAETHEEVAPGGYAYTQRTTGKVEFKDSSSWNPGKGWDRTPALDKVVTIVDKPAWDETVVDVAAYDDPDTVIYYTGKPAGSTTLEDAAWVRYTPTGWPTKVETRTVTDVPTTYACDFVKPVTTLLNPTPLVRPGFVFDLETTDNHLVTKTVGNIYRDGTLFKSFQSPTGSLAVPVNLPDGAYTLRYNGLDSVGNVASTATYDFVVDGTAPTVTDKGTAGAAARSKSFKLYDARRIDAVTINGVTKDLANSVWSDVNDIKPGRYGAVEGTNTLIAYDEAGNASAPVEFTLDTTGPVITDKGAAGKAGQSKSFKLFDPRRVDKVTINGETKDLINNVWSDVNDIKPGRYGAVEGTNTLIAYDELGNTTEITFVLDTTGPLVTEKDDSSETSRSFKLDDGPLGSMVAGVRVNGTDFPLSHNRWSDANDLSLGSPWGVRAGENTLVAYDVLGNETTVTFTIAAPEAAPATGANPQPEVEPESDNGSDSQTEPVVAPAIVAGNSVATPSDAGPVATTSTLAGPRASAATVLAPELVAERAATNQSLTGEGRQVTTAETSLIVDAGQVEAVDTVQAVAAAPVAVDDSLPGLGIAITAGGAMVAFGAVLGMRRRGRS